MSGSLSALACCGLMLGILAFAAPVSGPTRFPLRELPLRGCPGGVARIATFDFADRGFRGRHELRVIARGFATLEQTVARLKQGGLHPVAVLNAGYFQRSSSASYFKSSREGVESPSNSSFSPRACLVHEHDSGEGQVLQSTEVNYRSWKSAAGLEVFCAGPQLVRGGADIAREQVCAERFDPRCREDGRDPGLGFGASVARSAACVTGRGELKLFALSSPRDRCGATLPALTALMLAEGCADALNLDGGGSTKLYVDNGAGAPAFYPGAADPGRLIPVWVAVVERP